MSELGDACVAPFRRADVASALAARYGLAGPEVVIEATDRTVPVVVAALARRVVGAEDGDELVELVTSIDRSGLDDPAATFAAGDHEAAGSRLVRHLMDDRQTRRQLVREAADEAAVESSPGLLAAMAWMSAAQLRQRSARPESERAKVEPAAGGVGAAPPAPAIGGAVIVSDDAPSLFGSTLVAPAAVDHTVDHTVDRTAAAASPSPGASTEFGSDPVQAETTSARLGAAAAHLGSAAAHLGTVSDDLDLDQDQDQDLGPAPAEVAMTSADIAKARAAERYAPGTGATEPEAPLLFGPGSAPRSVPAGDIAAASSVVGEGRAATRSVPAGDIAAASSVVGEDRAVPRWVAAEDIAESESETSDGRATRQERGRAGITSFQPGRPASFDLGPLEASSAAGRRSLERGSSDLDSLDDPESEIRIRSSRLVVGLALLLVLLVIVAAVLWWLDREGYVLSETTSDAVDWVRDLIDR